MVAAKQQTDCHSTLSNGGRSASGFYSSGSSSSSAGVTSFTVSKPNAFKLGLGAMVRHCTNTHTHFLVDHQISSLSPIQHFRWRLELAV